MISEAELDKMIYAIVLECGSINPPLGSAEIEQIAVEQIEAQMRQQVKASLGRLVDHGRLAGQAETGAAQRYSLASAA